jgi:hypothetical protein
MVNKKMNPLEVYEKKQKEFQDKQIKEKIDEILKEDETTECDLYYNTYAYKDNRAKYLMGIPSKDMIESINNEAINEIIYIIARYLDFYNNNMDSYKLVNIKNIIYRFPGKMQFLQWKWETRSVYIKRQRNSDQQILVDLPQYRAIYWFSTEEEELIQIEYGTKYQPYSQKLIDQCRGDSSRMIYNPYAPFINGVFGVITPKWPDLQLGEAMRYRCQLPN